MRGDAARRRPVRALGRRLLRAGRLRRRPVPGGPEGRYRRRPATAAARQPARSGTGHPGRRRGGRRERGSLHASVHHGHRGARRVRYGRDTVAGRRVLHPFALPGRPGTARCRRHGGAGHRLQPRLVVHLVDAAVHRAGRTRDADDPRGGRVGRDRRWRTGAAPHRHRPPRRRGTGLPRDPGRPVPRAPGLPARCPPRQPGPAQRSADLVGRQRTERSGVRGQAAGVWRAMSTIMVQPNGITPADVTAVARHGARVELSPDTLDAMRASRSIVDGIEREGRPVYGVSTGFGALASTSIAPERRVELQHALIRSHAAGVGAPMPVEVVRAMILLRVRSLAFGRSGVRPLVAQALTDLLNNDITPWVPEHGSLGASGDLAPLAHCALVLLGEGWVLANSDAGHLFVMADVTAALSVEAMLGSSRPFMPELHEIRPHPGQAVSAANMHRLLQDSAIMASHRDDFTHAVQDAYSMRCAPQVAGAARDTLRFASEVADRELLSIVDNPVVLLDGRVESTGNFHGAPLGFAADYLAIAAAEVGAIAERRVDRLLDVCRSRDLPAFLTPDPGVNSGLMIAQYTAAGLVAENRRLAAPASVDSLPTSGMQEDHVSMGWAATCKLRTVLDSVTAILAVELLAAVRGLQLREPLTPSPAGRIAVQAVAAFTGPPGPDLFLAPALERARELIAGTGLREAIEAAIGPLA